LLDGFTSLGADDEVKIILDVLQEVLSLSLLN
jgi:hypothetical protein